MKDDINPNAPEWVKDLMNGGLRALRTWVKTATIAQIKEATDYIFVTAEERMFLIEEIEIRQQFEINKNLAELKEPHWIMKWTFGLVIISTIVGILALLAQVFDFHWR